MPVYLYGDSFNGGSAGDEAQILPQNTDAAAAQALEPQSFGDEFRPKPNPDIGPLVARYDALTKEVTACCDKLYMGKPLPYMEQEDVREKMQACEKELAIIRQKLNDIYEGNEYDEEGGPFTGDAQVVGKDAGG